MGRIKFEHGIAYTPPKYGGSESAPSGQMSDTFLVGFQDPVLPIGRGSLDKFPPAVRILEAALEEADKAFGPKVGQGVSPRLLGRILTSQIPDVTIDGLDETTALQNTPAVLNVYEALAAARTREYEYPKRRLL